MKGIYCLVVIVGMLFVGGITFARADSPAQDTKAAASTVKAQDAGNKICPVTGEKINEKVKATYEYQGKIYNFCCAMCIDAFKKDPQQYIKKVEDELRREGKQ